MHYDEEHHVIITQTHRAFVDQVTTYSFDSDAYVEFLQIDPDDVGAREEFILDRATFVGEENDINELTETVSVEVSDV